MPRGSWRELRRENSRGLVIIECVFFEDGRKRRNGLDMFVGDESRWVWMVVLCFDQSEVAQSRRLRWRALHETQFALCSAFDFKVRANCVPDMSGEYLFPEKSV